MNEPAVERPLTHGEIVKETIAHVEKSCPICKRSHDLFNRELRDRMALGLSLDFDGMMETLRVFRCGTGRKFLDQCQEAFDPNAFLQGYFQEEYDGAPTRFA